MSESPTDLPLPAFRFEVSLEPDEALAGVTGPICHGAFADCEGLEVSMEPRTVSPGGSSRQVHLPGPLRYGQLTLRRGVTTDTTLWSWMAAVGEPGRPLTAHGEVSLWDADGTPTLTFLLEGVLPVRLRGPSLSAREGQVAIEELSLVYGRLRIRPASAGAAGAAPGVAASPAGGVTGSASVGAAPVGPGVTP